MHSRINLACAIHPGLTTLLFALLAILATRESTWAAPGMQGGTTNPTLPTVPTPPYLFLPYIARDHSSTITGFTMTRPQGMVSASNRLFVASKTSNNVTAWDEISQNVIRTIPVGVRPWGVGASNNRVFVANHVSGSVSVIDVSGPSKIADIDLSTSCAGGPANVAVDASTNRVFVAMYGIGRVAVIDAATNALVECIATGKSGTFGVAVNAARRELYVTNRDGFDFQIWNINNRPATLSHDFALGGMPYFVQADSATSKAYLMVALDSPDYTAASSLYAYDATSGAAPALLKVIGNTDDGGAIGISHANGNLLVAATADGKLWILNPNTLATRSIAMVTPFGIAENSGLGRVYIGARSGDWVAILSNNQSP